MPAVAEVTGTMIVHPPAAGSVAPLLKVIEVPPATAVMLPLGQVPVLVAGVPRTRLGGRLSTKAEASVRAVAALLFPSVSLSEELLPSAMDAGVKVFATVGRASIWSVAVPAITLFPTVVL